jgi:hypothetical protein
MSDFIEVDGLRVGPNMWRDLCARLKAAREEIERLKSTLEMCDLGAAALADERDAARERERVLREALESVRADWDDRPGWVTAVSMTLVDAALAQTQGPRDE